MTHHKKMDELIENVRPYLHSALDKALASGALTEELKEGDNYLLAKMVFTLYMRQEPFRGLSPATRKEMKNLEHFI